MFKKNIFQQNIIKLREFYGWNSAEFARQIGMSVSTTSCWELGKRLPSIPALWKVADLFEISVDQLIGREPLPDWVKKGKHD